MPSIEHMLFSILMCCRPDGAVRPGGNVQCDGDGDGALSTQGGHGSLCLTLVSGGFDPCAAQVGQLVELDTALLQHWGADWSWTCASQCWTYLNRTTIHLDKRDTSSERHMQKQVCRQGDKRMRENHRGCGEGLHRSARTFKLCKQEVEQWK